MTISSCPVCGKLRAHHSHKACSRKLQRLYAPGTALYDEQAKDLANRKASRIIMPIPTDAMQKKVGGVFSRLRKGED